MNTQLQLELIRILKDNGGILGWVDLKSKINALYFYHRDLPKYKGIPSDKDIVAQLSLLIDDEAVERIESTHHLLYRLKKWEYKIDIGGLEMVMYWILNKNHNVISFFALLLAILSFVISFIK